MSLNKLPANHRKIVSRVANTIQCSETLAKDLLLMAGWDEDLVIEASDESNTLSLLKATIIDQRFSKLERKENEQNLRTIGNDA